MKFNYIKNNIVKYQSRIIAMFVMTSLLIITLLSTVVSAVDVPTSGSTEKPFMGEFQPLPYYNGLLNTNSASNHTLFIAEDLYETVKYGMYTQTDDIVYIGFIKNNSNKYIVHAYSHVANFNVTCTLITETNLTGKPITYNGKTYYYASFEPNYDKASGTNFIFNSTNEILAAIDIIESAPTTSPASINYDLPPGNIAIIETDSSYSYINLKTTMPLQSTSFSSNPWPNSTQRIGYYNNLPQSISPNTMGNIIEWERNGNTTLFNVTTSAKYNPNIVSTFKYVVIANPYYYPANDMDDRQFTNGAININMDDVVNITVKSLTATVNMQTGEVEDNYNGEEWTGEIDVTTNDIIWTDGNGDNNAPTSGGNLSDPSITGFQSWLKGILNNIVNIFEPAHDAISTLSGTVSNFASWMYALYVWLPSPILTLLTSAISLAIVIGIIKVFI